MKDAGPKRLVPDQRSRENILPREYVARTLQQSERVGFLRAPSALLKRRVTPFRSAIRDS
eukprot:1675861-Pyramimonas_sp.AAC.3